MKLVPLSTDVAQLIGEQAQAVENRSLLLEKFVIPKSWVNRDGKLDDASKWSLLRVADGGSPILQKEAEHASFEARKGKSSKAGLSAEIKAAILPLLADTAVEASDAKRLRASHSRRFLDLARKSLPQSSATFCARLRSRLAINLSDGLIENAGIALDRLFGLPYIPGSALKGCARHAALAEVDATAEEERKALVGRLVAVFGNTDGDWKEDGAFGSRTDKHDSPSDRKGGVTFVAAYPVTTDDTGIEVDLTNVHTPDYYTDKNRAGNSGLLAIEKPRPNPFPVVKSGTVFGFTIALNAIGQRSEHPDQVLDDAHRWLEQALTVFGIGAKTSAGYGWFALAPDVDEQLRAESKRENEAREKERIAAEQAALKEKEKRERFQKLGPVEKEMEILDELDDQEFANRVLQLDSCDENTARAIIKTLRNRRKDRWKKWKKSKKQTDAKRVAAVENVIRKLEIKPLS